MDLISQRPRYTLSKAQDAYKHNARVPVTAEVVDVEDADLATFAALHALDVLDTPPDLRLALGVCALNLLERWPVELGERGADLVDGNAVALQTPDEGWPQQTGGDVAALVTRLVRT